MNDEAKAAKEIAKTAGKGIDAGRELGGFIARFISGPIEQGMGIFEDKLKYMRWERQLRLKRRAEQYLREIGLEEPTRAVPMKIAIPLIQAASLEEDDELQDTWVRLLVNAGDSSRDLEVKRMYITILEDLASLEVEILNTIYSSPDLRDGIGIWTHELPDTISLRGPKNSDTGPTPEVQLAIANLIRVGCLAPSSSYGGDASLEFIYPTHLGKKLYEACTLRKK